MYAKVLRQGRTSCVSVLGAEGGPVSLEFSLGGDGLAGSCCAGLLSQGEELEFYSGGRGRE